MSTVVEAEVIGNVPFATDGRVALKVLHREISDDQESIARLLREADLVRSLAHDNVCAIFDMGRTLNGRPYLVMELLRGQSLAERITRGPLSVSEAVAVLQPVLAALEAAHARGVVHRDLKPDNIFIVNSNERKTVKSKLLDFGVARSFDGDREKHRLTDTGMVMGTPYYMAPEQARGERKLDQRIDVWAIGVILYEALTGERPFVATNYNALLVKILTQQPRKLSIVAPWMTSVISMVVEKALSKRAEDRFQTVRELADALRLAEQESGGTWSDLDDPTVALGERHCVAEPTVIDSEEIAARFAETVAGARNLTRARPEPTESQDGCATEIIRRR